MITWYDFSQAQRTILDQLHSTFPADERPFESLSFLQGHVTWIAGRKLASERDHKDFRHTIVEVRVQDNAKGAGWRTAGNP
jgi:hypothetical protein